MHLVAATMREERDVHRFGNGTLRARPEIDLQLCVLDDDQPVAYVARSATIGRLPQGT